ncbi:hydrogenase small subunit [Deferribacterales bacterium RsTz2092]|nr:oxidoreductase [Deferribacterales bacterium]
MLNDSIFSAALSRRDFMKTITTLTAAMGLPAAFAPQVAAAAEGDKRPPVIWLHFQECTGCSESLLRSSHPDLVAILLDTINLEYQETIMAGAGLQAEEALETAHEKYAGEYLLVVEGAVPLLDDGGCCKIGGLSAQESLQKLATDAFAVVCMGTCASIGGIVTAQPNPTKAVSVASLVNDKPVINLPGCPPNPYNLPATILYLLTFGKLPELDSQNRPKFAYGRLVHDHCERRSHFDAGRFAKAFGHETHALGYCLYELGCKGPVTHANCPELRFNDGTAWPISIGHPCIGCTEHVAFNTAVSDKAAIVDPASPSWFPPTNMKPAGKPASVASALGVGVALGGALGYAAGRGQSLPDGDEQQEEHRDE